MDIINILVAGNSKSGKTTFANALKLTKFNSHIHNIIEYNDFEISNYFDRDIMFYVMQLHDNLENLYISDILKNLDQCMIIPVINKLDLFDFTIDEKTMKISIDDHIDEKINEKLECFKQICETSLGNNVYCDERIFCSAELAYMYLYLSTYNSSTSKKTITLTNIDPKIVSKIGQYELGKLQWNKKTANERTIYVHSIIDQLKKQSKLTSILCSVGYSICSILNKHITDQVFLYMVQKHLHNFKLKFDDLIKYDSLIHVLNYTNNEFICNSDPNFLTTYADTTNIINSIVDYIDKYDYTSLDFQTKTEILAYYKDKENNLFSYEDISNVIKKNINFLTMTLSQEIGYQLNSCETFVELVDKLYEYLDINDDIYVDQILLNHKSLKTSLFNDSLQTNIEYALSRFELDTATFFLKIIEMKLDVLLNENCSNGIIESMLCVKDFLDSKPTLIGQVPTLTKYKILLNYALLKNIHSCNFELLLSKIENNSTLYVENKYYNLLNLIESDNESVDEPSPKPIRNRNFKSK